MHMDHWRQLCLWLTVAVAVSCTETPQEPYQEGLPSGGFAANNAHEKSTLPALPFWSRLGGSGILPRGIPETDEWGVIHFYVTNPENQVPRDFNLLTTFDQRARSAESSVSITRWFIEGHPVPAFVKLKGKGAVPFWFITSGQVDQIVADDAVTMDELLALDPPPLVGYADHFDEHQRSVVGGSPVQGTLTRATGTLDDGRDFRVYIHTRVVQNDVRVEIDIK